MAEKNEMPTPNDADRQRASRFTWGPGDIEVISGPAGGVDASVDDVDTDVDADAADTDADADTDKGARIQALRARVDKTSE